MHTMVLQGSKSVERAEAAKDAELMKQHYQARAPPAKKLLIALPKRQSTIYANGTEVYERHSGSGASSRRRRLLRNVNHYPGYDDDDDEDNPQIFSSASCSEESEDVNEVKKAKASSNAGIHSHLYQQSEPERGRSDRESSYPDGGTDSRLERHQESGRCHHPPEVSNRSSCSSLDSLKKKSSDPVCITDGLSWCLPMNMISCFQPPWY
jgi:hypothetical protein